MATIDNVELQLKFDRIVDIVHRYKRITSVDVDATKEQFELFLETDLNMNPTEFKSFDSESTRLDDSLGQFLRDKKCSALWQICQFIFTMSHGQSSVKRGFNINKDMLIKGEGGAGS